MRTRINLVLVLVLVVCGLLLVDSQHRARKLFIELERMQTRSRELDIQFKQLQLDQLRLAKASMIDQRARRDLGMTSASADRTMYLTMPPVLARPPKVPLALAAESPSAHAAAAPGASGASAGSAGSGGSGAGGASGVNLAGGESGASGTSGVHGAHGAMGAVGQSVAASSTPFRADPAGRGPNP